MAINLQYGAAMNMVGTPVSEACRHLLDRSSIYQPLYGNRLSSHLPMALIALDRLGADASQLQAFFDHYRRRLQPRQPSQAAVDPLRSLGVLEDFEPVLAYFERQLIAQGHASVLSTWVPRLMPGVAASAFHALIRLAYALEANHPGEIAFGLASWTTEHRTLGALGMTTTRSLDEIAQLTTPIVAREELGPGIIIDRMAKAATLVAAAGSATQPESVALDDIVAFALRAYHAREDFTLLHLVTASHALRLVLPHVPPSEHDATLRHFWHAVLHGYLSVEQTDSILVTQGGTTAEEDWSPCLALAARSLDDHVVKLTYTAWQQAGMYKDPRYLQVARRKNGLLP